MAKKSDGASAFDELLETIGNGVPEDREALAGLAERHPALRESVLRQSDYSRKFNELQNEVKLAERWNQWRQENWLDDPENPGSGYTKRELELQQETQRLKEEKEEAERRLASRTSDEDPEVNLEELEKTLSQKILSQVQGTIAAKEKEFNERLNSSNNVNTRLTLDTARLLMNHEKEFGEELNPDELYKAAFAKGRSDLKEFYDQEYAQPRRIAKERSAFEEKLKANQLEFESKLAAQQKEFEERADKMKGMGSGGPTPSEATPSEMGAFQKRYLGLTESTDGKNSNGVPDKAVLGGGMIAQIAARNEFEKAAGRL